MTVGLHPELAADAERVLTEAGLPHRQIVAVDYDAILYKNQLGKARTCWLRRQHGSGRLKVRMMAGFPAEPPVGWHDESS